MPYAGLTYAMMNVIKKVIVMMIITIKMITTTRMVQYCYAVHGVPYASLMYVVLWDHTSHTVPTLL